MSDVSAEAMRKAARRLFWEAKQAEIRQSAVHHSNTQAKTASEIADWLDDMAECELSPEFIDSAARVYGVQKELAHVLQFARYQALTSAASDLRKDYDLICREDDDVTRETWEAMKRIMRKFDENLTAEYGPTVCSRHKWPALLPWPANDESQAISP